MLQKQIDQLIVSNDYIAFLLGIRLLKQGKKVTIIAPNDEQDNSNLETFSKLTVLQKLILEKWGKEYPANPLSELSTHIQNMPLFISLDSTQLCLLSSPTHNLREIVRKMAFLFEKDAELISIWNNPALIAGIDHAYMDLCYIIIDNNITNIQDFSNQLINENIIYRYFKAILNFYHNGHENFQKKLLGKLFIYALNGIFRNYLGQVDNDNQLFYLFLSALSPQLYMNLQTPYQDLLNFFTSNGGEFKRSSIASSKHAKEWQIQLSSFDGVIMAKDLLIIDDKVNLLKLRSLNFLEAICITWDSNTNDYYEEIFLKTEQLGSDFPYFKLNITKDKVTLKIFTYRIKERANTKQLANFIDLFKSYLKQTYPEISLRNEKVDYTHDFINTENDHSSKQSDWGHINTLLDIIK